MRKPYQKPMLYVERFELSEHIAMGCARVDSGDTTDAKSPYDCNFDWYGIKVFMKTGVCDKDGYTLLDPDNNDFFCYHNPDPSQAIFAS